MQFPLQDKKIWVTGHTGLVGSALLRQLTSRGIEPVTVAREELDLTDQQAVLAWVESVRPDVVFHCAAKVGGIKANSEQRVEFLYDNLQIGLNILKAADISGVSRVINLSSACIYPRDAAQPLTESQILTAQLEPTNEAYALAKISVMKSAQYYNEQYGRNFITAIPTNSYGPNDNFELDSAHVPAALMRKMYDAKYRNATQVEVWGTGKPIRDFIYIDDMASAILFVAENYFSSEPINISTGLGCSIYDLANMIKQVSGYSGELVFNSEKPDGMPKKVLSNKNLVELGWQPEFDLQSGLEKTWQWIEENAGVNCFR